MLLYADNTQGAETKVVEQVYQITGDPPIGGTEFPDLPLLLQVFTENLYSAPAPGPDPVQRSHENGLPEYRRSPGGDDRNHGDPRAKADSPLYHTSEIPPEDPVGDGVFSKKSKSEAYSSPRRAFERGFCALAKRVETRS